MTNRIDQFAIRLEHRAICTLPSRYGLLLAAPRRRSRPCPLDLRALSVDGWPCWGAFPVVGRFESGGDDGPRLHRRAGDAAPLREGLHGEGVHVQVRARDGDGRARLRAGYVAPVR